MNRLARTRQKKAENVGYVLILLLLFLKFMFTGQPNTPSGPAPGTPQEALNKQIEAPPRAVESLEAGTVSWYNPRNKKRFASNYVDQTPVAHLGETRGPRAHLFDLYKDGGVVPTHMGSHFKADFERQKIEVRWMNPASGMIETILGADLNWAVVEQTAGRVVQEGRLKAKQADWIVQVTHTYNAKKSSIESIYQLLAQDGADKTTLPTLLIRGFQSVSQNPKLVRMTRTLNTYSVLSPASKALNVYKTPKKNIEDALKQAETISLVDPEKKSNQRKDLVLCNMERFGCALLYILDAEDLKRSDVAFVPGVYTKQSGDFPQEMTVAYQMESKPGQPIRVQYYVGENNKELLEATGIPKAVDLVVYRDVGYSLSKLLKKYLNENLYNQIKRAVKPNDVRRWGDSAVGWMLLIFLLALCINVFYSPFSYKMHIVQIKKQFLSPEISRIRAKYKKEADYQLQQREENELYRRYGINHYALSVIIDSFLFPLFSIVMWRQFFSAQIDFRGLALFRGLISDLSEPDYLIHLPFGLYIPYVGAKISFLVLVSIFLQIVSFHIRQGGNNDQKSSYIRLIIGYVVQFYFFLYLFNTCPAIVSLYYICNLLVNLLIKLLLSKFVNKAYHIEEAIACSKKNQPTNNRSRSPISRSLSRLNKKRKKTK